MKNLYCIFEIQLNNIFSNEYDQSSTNVGPLKKNINTFRYYSAF